MRWRCQLRGQALGRSTMFSELDRCRDDGSGGWDRPLDEGEGVTGELEERLRRTHSWPRVGYLEVLSGDDVVGRRRMSLVPCCRCYGQGRPS